jgi:Domain of unknown function (DUF4375)
MELPTAQTVDEWDDASLFAACGYRATERARVRGIASLNEAERVLCYLFLLDNEVNNGGFGQWLFNCHPHALGLTAWACQRVGANAAGRLVDEVLAPVDNPSQFADIDTWREYLDALPEALHGRFEDYTSEFVQAEPELLNCAYRFARARWSEVDTA